MSLPLPSPPRRIILASEAHAHWVPRLTERRPDLDVRGTRMAEVTPEMLDWAEAYIGFRRPAVATMGQVRWVHCTGAGVDGWMAPGALPTDILLTRTTESFGPPIAEWALARALGFTQRWRELEEAQRTKRWARDCEPHMLAGQPVLVVGTGDVGTHVARLFAAIGCPVVGVSRTGAARPEHGTPSVFTALAPFTALPALVASAKVIVLTAPLTPDTRGLLSRDVLARCTGAVLLNAGRGALVDEQAILPALDAGQLAGCALDVFETEPLPAESPLWSDPRVVVSPHVSGPSTATGTIDGIVETLEALERGRVPRTVVDRVRGY
ncbi:MAG: D-2-hydroxyacid dehydrogenase [Gemmatimonadaceae bacterium]|nr:D-2-hydroxyacid dehydrogenase [Gemmatimonadaceae bacterium]